MMDEKTKWPEICHHSLEKTIALFKKELPNWWYSLGECQVSCDASCAPTKLSPDIELIEKDEQFNSGFHADVPQPSSLSAALLVVMHAALSAKALAEGDEAKAKSLKDVADMIFENGLPHNKEV